MEILINLFNLILYQPLFNALILLYLYLPGHDFGLAVIVLTLIIRIIFYPLMVQSIRSQKILSELQPQIQEIQRKYKADKEQQAREMMELYRKAKINPFSGLFPLLLQLPILIALYRVFWQGLEPEQLSQLYNFVPQPGQISPSFFGLLNLSQPSLILAALAGLGQFLQVKMATPRARKEPIAKTEIANFSRIFQKQMLYFFPIFTVIILWRLPAAIGLYWLVTTLFSIFQQFLIFKPRTFSKQV